MTEAQASSATKHSGRLAGWLWPFGLSLFLSILIVLPFFWLGTASGHDFEFHAASWLDVASQWKEGILFPRWAGWANHGFGEPRYIFYPPLSWMLGAALTLLAPGAAVPVLFVILVQTFAGLSAYSLLRRFTTSRAAVLGAACYVINPNALLMIYIRSDFAEQLACAFLPLIFLAALRLCAYLNDTPRKLSTLPFFAISFAAVWLSNAPAGVIASYSMALLFAWAAVSQRSWRLFLRGMVGLALGFGLTAFYLVPAAYEQRWVNIGQALSSGLIPAQNFLFTAINDPEHTWFNWIASICALSLILLFALAALASRQFTVGTPSVSLRKACQCILVLGAAAILLTLRFTLPLWDHLPKLRFVQFPWRWMSIIAVAASSFLALAIQKRRGWLWFAIILVLSVPLASLLVQNTWWDPDEMPAQFDAINSGHGFDGTDEYDPLGDDHLDLPPNALLAAVLPEDSTNSTIRQATIRYLRWTSDNKEMVVNSKAEARVALRLLNYPAWHVQVNGKTVQPERMDDFDQMVIPIAAGKSDIRVRFARTPDRMAGNIISAASVFLAAILLWVGRKRASGGA